ncbi:MAG: succinylglutamate desuccinylase/aspartoacylase family protein, partial [Woeseiaceae bacterium]
MSLRQPDDLATALTVSLALLALVSGPVDAAESASLLPDGIVTHEDGRLRIKELFESYLELRARGWELDVIADSEPAGAEYALPIIALRTPHDGAAVWILAGIHGEEPAGPNAIAAAIDDLAALGETRAVVLLPLLNPHGYARNWRYLNT